MNILKNLVVWQKAMDASVLVYKLTQKFPKEEMFGLVSQMRRASVSIASNIAEGQGRNNKGDKDRFLDIANGSRIELQTQLILSERIGFVNQGDIEELLKYLDEIGKMLYALKQKAL